MKAQKFIRLLILLIAVTGLTFSGCKKDSNTSTADPTSLQQLTEDDNAMQNASDEAMNDVDVFLAGNHTKSTENLPCNATIDSTSVVNDTITYYITYNGWNCNHNRFRVGQVEIKKKVGTFWPQPGATVIVKHINFQIYKKGRPNKTITLNGTKTHQNVNGGTIWMLGNGLTSLVYKTWGYETVTFPNNKTRTWNIARQKTITGTPGQLVMTLDGFGSENSYSNLVMWGINQNGEQFYTRITQSVVLRQECDWDPCSGVKIHEIPSDSKSATITYGFDSNNQPVTGTDCPEKYRVDWQKNNHSGTYYLWLP